MLEDRTEPVRLAESGLVTGEADILPYGTESKNIQVKWSRIYRLSSQLEVNLGRGGCINQDSSCRGENTDRNIHAGSDTLQEKGVRNKRNHKKGQFLMVVYTLLYVSMSTFNKSDITKISKVPQKLVKFQGTVC